MSPNRAAVLLLVAAVLAALAVALVSRTPAEVREAKPGPEANDPELGAHFTDDQIARHGAYRRAAYVSLALSTLLELLALFLLARALMPSFVRLVERVPGGWPVVAVLAVAFLVVVTTAVALPVSFVRGFVMDHAWGLSTRSLGGWVSDAARSLGIGLVMSSIAVVAFFGLVRAFPTTWWLWGGAIFSLLTIALTFLFPIVIAPLFNTFTPLEDEALRTRVVALAEEAGVELDDVLVADASKRTTAENAYVAGIGATKRMVLYDTLVEAGGAGRDRVRRCARAGSRGPRPHLEIHRGRVRRASDRLRGPRPVFATSRCVGVDGSLGHHRHPSAPRGGPGGDGRRTPCPPAPERSVAAFRTSGGHRGDRAHGGCRHRGRGLPPARVL